MSSAQQLYELQALDLERDKLRLGLKEVRSQLGETDELRATRAQLERTQAELADWRARRRDLALETQTLETKLAAAEERMYGGQVTNPKELADLQKESIALSKHRGALDDKSLQAMQAVEERETTLNQIQAALADIETSWTAQQRRLTQERAEIEAQLEQLDKSRAEHTRGVSPADLAQYDFLRQRKNGLAVAAIEDGFCSTCGVEISNHKLALVALDESLVFCGNCERILIE